MSSLLEDQPNNSGDVPMHMDPLSQSIANNEFQFQQTLALHQGAVRCLCVLPDTDDLVSGSIDGSAKYMAIDKSTGQYTFEKDFTYHDSFVLGVHPNIGKNGFYTASKDRKIMHVDSTGNPSKLFEGHENCVNSLSQSSPDELVSGSWDGTARIWDTNTGKCTNVLEGHQHAVCVLSLPNGIVITGSQDKSIRLWYKGEQQKEIPNAHDDIIRQFTEVPGLRFASCSNDETVKLWSTDGNLLQTFKGHMGFVFAVTTLLTGEIASGGDDCLVKIWNTDGTCKQTIIIPKTVWAITQNSLGDLIVGSEDYKVRTFTKDEARINKGADLKEYEEELKSKTTASDLSQFEKAPDISEQGSIVGKSEGDIQVFKKDGVPSAYMWKTAEHKWEYVGEVVDPNAGAGGGANMGMVQAPKKYAGDALFPAGEYDHIFDVELGDNVMRKLPFNNGDNAIVEAEKFCVREDLGRNNIDQIRAFIQQHSQNFRTRDANVSAGGTQVKPNEPDNTMRTTLYYDNIKIEGPKKKILEFNASASFLDQKELKVFESLCVVLADRNQYYKTKVNDYMSELLDKLIQLPVDKVFPCLDLYRIFLCHPDATCHSKKFEEGCHHLFAILGHLYDKSASDPTKMLALRCLVNMFKEHPSIFVIRSKAEKVIEAVAPHLQNPKTTIREAAITVFLNLSIQYLAKNDQPERKIQIISSMGHLVNEAEPQCLKRAQTTMNNLTYQDYEAKKLAEGLGFKF